MISDDLSISTKDGIDKIYNGLMVNTFNLLNVSPFLGLLGYDNHWNRYLLLELLKEFVLFEKRLKLCLVILKNGSHFKCLILFDKDKQLHYLRLIKPLIKFLV